MILFFGFGVTIPFHRFIDGSVDRSRSGSGRSQGFGPFLCWETDGASEGKGRAAGGGGLAKCQFTDGMGGWYNRGTGSKFFFRYNWL